MAQKQQIYDGFSVFMMETQQKLSKQGIKKKVADLQIYCRPLWGKIPDQEKAKYKSKAKGMNSEFKYEKYTSIGVNVEDIKKKYNDSKTQEVYMYQFIEQLIRANSSSHRLPKQKFIFIHINSYVCEKDQFYFPAEISMAEFSLEGGLIRIFHQLVGFDKDKTNAPPAPTADINTHAIHNHKITPFTKFPNNYTSILLKIIGFIIQQDVNEDMLYDLDLPPVYTAHSSTNNELMMTTSSLYQLYQCSVNNDCLDNFSKIFTVYQLDKLFMEFKNESYNIKYPDARMMAVPSVAIAADTLTKGSCYSVKSIGCNFHDKLDEPYICSNYIVCNWIYIFSTHCCQYFNIKAVSGCHYDFDLSNLETQMEKSIKNLNISKKNDDYAKYFEPSPKTSTAISFPALGGESSTPIQKPTWNKTQVEHKVKPQGDTVKNNDNNFPPLGNSQKAAPGNNPTVKMNSWHSGSGKGIVNQAQNNTVPLSGNSKKPGKGRGMKNKGGK